MPSGEAMTRDRARRGDRIEEAIEAVLQPGRFIAYGAAWSFVDSLEKVEAQIAKLVRTSPARAVALYETFVAGCYEKAEEIDDSNRSCAGMRSAYCKRELELDGQRLNDAYPNRGPLFIGKPPVLRRSPPTAGMEARAYIGSPFLVPD